MTREELLKMREEHIKEQEEFDKFHPVPRDVIISVYKANNEKQGFVEYDVYLDRIRINGGGLSCTFDGDCLASLRDALNKLLD
jgi:hypothetical protein